MILSGSIYLMRLSLILIFCIIGCTSSASQNMLYFSTSNTENPVSDWVISGRGMIDMQIDSSSMIDGRAPLKLSCPTGNFFGQQITFVLSTSLSRTFLLPESSSKNTPITIKLRYKSLYLDTAQMIVTSLNEQEKILQIDTLMLVKDTPWQWFSHTLSDNSSRLLNIEIRVVGNEPVKNPSLWLDQIKLKQESKLIAPVSFSTCKPNIKQEDVTAFSPFNLGNYHSLSSTINSPIVAIGEWLHGSETIEKVAFEFLKYRILNHNTKLILIELPLEMMLSVNRFVEGDEAFQLDSIWQDFDYYFYSEPTRQFMIWLKNYNQNSNEKVNFLGTEINIESLSSKLQLHDFFCRLSSRYPQNEKLNCFLQELLSSTSDHFVEGAKLFEKNDLFSDILTHQEVAIIQFYFKNGAQLNTQNLFRFLERDELMFKNCTFLFDLFKIDSMRTASLYTHIGHANYQYLQLEFPQLKSTGQMLKEYYVDAYSCIGLHALKGEFLTFDDKSSQCKITPLRTIKNSLEEALIKLDKEEGFISTKRLNQLLLVSTYGVSENNQRVTLVNPYTRMEGIIFLKESRPQCFKYLLEPIKTPSQRALEKYEKKLRIFGKR